jgi:hypothetical protein
MQPTADAERGHPFARMSTADTVAIPFVFGDPRASLSPRHPGAVTRRGDGRSVLPHDNATWGRPGNQDQTKRDTFTRNPAAWHAEAQGLRSPADRRHGHAAVDPRGDVGAPMISSGDCIRDLAVGST